MGDPTDVVPEGLFGALLQYPGSSGALRDDEGVIRALHEAGVLVVVAPVHAEGAGVDHHLVPAAQAFGAELQQGQAGERGQPDDDLNFSLESKRSVPQHTQA